MSDPTMKTTSAGVAQETGLARHGQIYASANHVDGKALPTGSPACTIRCGRQQVAIGAYGFYAPGQTYGI